MRRLALCSALLCILGAVPSLAQAPDQCAAPIGPGPATELMQRLRCTIQVLDAERMLAVDQKTDAEVRARMAEAKAARLEAEELARLSPKITLQQPFATIDMP